MAVVTFSKVEKFHGKDVRTYEADDGNGNVERCMTIPDLARMVGYLPREIRRIVDRHSDEFLKSGQLRVVTTLKDFPNTPRGRKPQFVLTLGGVTNTLLYLESSRINDPEKRAKVREFRDWAVQVLVSFQRGKHLEAEVAPGNKTTVGEVVAKAIESGEKDKCTSISTEVKNKSRIEIATETLKEINMYLEEQKKFFDLTTFFGSDRNAVAAHIYYRAEEDTGYDMTPLRVSLPLAPDDVPVYSAGDLCKLHYISYPELERILVDEEIIMIKHRDCPHQFKHRDILLRERGYDLGCGERQYLSKKNKKCSCKSKFVLYSGNVRKILYRVCGNEGERRFYENLRMKENEA